MAFLVLTDAPLRRASISDIRIALCSKLPSPRENNAKVLHKVAMQRTYLILDPTWTTDTRHERLSELPYNSFRSTHQFAEQCTEGNHPLEQLAHPSTLHNTLVPVCALS